ncbi:hypothetical protein ACS0TY_030073 [Phlomoides rotata]
MSTFVPLARSDKLAKFIGSDFKRRQQKVLFYLTTLNLARFLRKDPLTIEDGDNNQEQLNALNAWDHNDFLCRNYILNGLDDSLYSVLK